MLSVLSCNSCIRSSQKFENGSTNLIQYIEVECQVYICEFLVSMERIKKILTINRLYFNNPITSFNSFTIILFKLP